MSNSDQLHHNGRALELFHSGELADCVIEVQSNDPQNKTEFNVHKFVLVLNSDVFNAMFRHKSTKEFRESRIQIKDSTPTSVHQMLLYMYGRKLPDNYDIEKDAIDLLKIANKYQIKSLMDLIEEQLIKSLSLENVFDRLELVDLCQLNDLKKFCSKMILENLPIVKKDVRWIELKKKSPDLVISILEKFADRLYRVNEIIKSSPELFS